MIDRTGSPWLTYDEAAEYLKCSRRHVFRLADEGALPVRRRGRLVRFRMDDLDAFLEAGATSAA